jgi:hypothetical protein
LAEAITAILAPDYRPDNPVIRARGRIEIARSVSSENKVLYDQLLTLQERVGALELGRIKRSVPDSLNGGEQFYITLQPGASVSDAEYNLGSLLELRRYSWQAEQLPNGVLLLRVPGLQAGSEDYKKVVDLLRTFPPVKLVEPVL